MNGAIREFPTANGMLTTKACPLRLRLSRVFTGTIGVVLHEDLQGDPAASFNYTPCAVGKDLDQVLLCTSEHNPRRIQQAEPVVSHRLCRNKFVSGLTVRPR